MSGIDIRSNEDGTFSARRLWFMRKEEWLGPFKTRDEAWAAAPFKTEKKK